jgi:sporulation protein YlmC with PRC-barrel domain
MRTRSYSVLAIVAALLLPYAGIASAQMDTPPPVTDPSDITGGNFPPEQYIVLPVPRGDLESVKKNRLLHKDVLDDHGKKVGTLEKLILDTKTGKIVYAVVSLENGRLAPLPWSDLRTTREQNVTIIHATKEQLDTAVGETAREIKLLMRPGLLSGSHSLKGELIKIEGGDYVMKDHSGQRLRLHIEEGTKIQGDPQAGDMIEAHVNDFDTATTIKAIRQAKASSR